MASAGVSGAADARGVAVEVGGMGLEPPDGEVGLGDLRRVRMVGGEVEVVGGDDESALGEPGVDERRALPVAGVPRAAVSAQQHGIGPSLRGTAHRHEERLAVDAQVLHVLGDDVEPGGGVVGRHGLRIPEPAGVGGQGDEIPAFAGMTEGALIIYVHHLAPFGTIYSWFPGPPRGCFGAVSGPVQGVNGAAMGPKWGHSPPGIRGARRRAGMRGPGGSWGQGRGRDSDRERDATLCDSGSRRGSGG